MQTFLFFIAVGLLACSQTQAQQASLTKTDGTVVKGTLIKFYKGNFYIRGEKIAAGDVKSVYFQRPSKKTQPSDTVAKPKANGHVTIKYNIGPNVSGYGREIKGTVTNKLGRTVKGTQVKFEFLDNQGVILGTETGYLGATTFKNGDTSAFTIPIFVSDKYTTATKVNIMVGPSFSDFSHKVVIEKE